MNQAIFILLLIIALLITRGQGIYKQAHFPGGDDSLRCLIETTWNQELIESYKSKGKVFVRWRIDKLGQIGEIELNPKEITSKATHLTFVQDISILNEIRKAYSNLPQWEPESMSGKKFESQWTQMIDFPYKKRCPRSD